MSEECMICTLPAARDGLCPSCLRMRAFSKTRPAKGCICPAAVLGCGNEHCPRRSMRITHQPAIAHIQEVVAEAFGTSVAAMRGAKRDQDNVRPRHIAIYLASETTHANAGAIGRMFGGRDHTTVIAAKEKIRERIDRDIEFAGLVETLRRRVMVH